MASGFLFVGVTFMLFTIQSTLTAKVLVIPFNHKSHINMFSQLGNALVEDGHEVWALTDDKFQKSLESKSMVTIPFPVPEDADIKHMLIRYMEKVPSGKGMFDTVTKEIPDVNGRFCDLALSNLHVMNTIKKQKFDLVVIDGVVGFTCMYTIPYKFDIPYITVHAFKTVSWLAGVTGMPSIEPDVMLELTNRMNFWERMKNLRVWMASLHDPIAAIYDGHFLQKYAPEKPKKTFSTIVKGSEMFLLNYEIFCLDYPRVYAPNYQFLGPSTVSPVKPLPKDLEAFVQGAEHGIVVMTIGSFKAWQFTWFVLREKMFSAFARLKQRVIVQYSLDGDVGNVPDNVLLLKWLPQNDLLGHPKTKLSIVHGGQNSLNEGVYHGVPMLVIPISIDHFSAGARVEFHGYGRYVRDIETVTSDEVFDTMQEILYNGSYSDNIKKCSRIISTMPSAQEKFVFWVNHILEFGGSHLRPPSLDMPLYQVLMLDIVAFFVLIGLAIFHIILIAAYLGYRYVVKRSKTKKE